MTCNLNLEHTSKDYIPKTGCQSKTRHDAKTCMKYLPPVTPLDIRHNQWHGRIPTLVLRFFFLCSCERQMARISCEQRHQNEEQKSVKREIMFLGVGGTLLRVGLLFQMSTTSCLQVTIFTLLIWRSL